VVTSPPEKAEAKLAETKPEVSKPLPMLSIDPVELSEQIQEAVAKLNEQMKTMQRDLGFSYDERLHREIVTVRKQSTGEVVRQLPPEVVLRVAHSIEDLKGLLYDDIF
jgi:flagellar protein FlaG